MVKESKRNFGSITGGLLAAAVILAAVSGVEGFAVRGEGKAVKGRKISPVTSNILVRHYLRVHSQNRPPLCILFVMSEPVGCVRIDPV